MQEKKIKEVTKKIKELYDRGMKAAKQKNYPYAIDMLITALKNDPEFYDARVALRKYELLLINNKSSVFRQMLCALTTFHLTSVKGPSMITAGKYSEALHCAETILRKDPTYLGGIKLLAKAAEEAELMTTCRDILEHAKKFHPKNIDILDWLAYIYGETGMGLESLKIRQIICDLMPTNNAAKQKLKDATALAAMSSGNWDKAAKGEASYQDLLKDKEGAQSLEKMERASKDVDAVGEIIEAELAKINEDPSYDGQATRKKLADLYVTKKDFDQAISNYEKCMELGGAGDPGIEAALENAHVGKFDLSIKEWKDVAETDENQKEEAEKNIAIFTEQKNEYLLTNAKSRVERYPNDANYHMELAELLWENNLPDEAVPEFQAAQRSPRFKNRAIFMMGMCFKAKGQIDIAIDQFKTAISAMLVMDRDKKLALYELGLAYKEQGKKDEALAAIKEIYQVDVNFKDVSALMDEFYSN